MGSVASKQVFDFTEGLSLKDWWKAETKNHKDRFVFEILKSYDNIDAKDLVIEEKIIQEQLDVLSEEYFNQSIATEGFVSRKNTEHTKRKKSEATKKYWSTPEGISKRKRLSERNARVKSKEMKERWKAPTDKMLNKKMEGRPKGARDLNPRKSRPKRMVMIEKKVYESADEAAKVFNINPVNVRRRCRMDKYTDWCYV